MHAVISLKMTTIDFTHIRIYMGFDVVLIYITLCDWILEIAHNLQI